MCVVCERDSVCARARFVSHTSCVCEVCETNAPLQSNIVHAISPETSFASCEYVSEFARVIFFSSCIDVCVCARASMRACVRVFLCRVCPSFRTSHVSHECTFSMECCV